MPLSGACFSIVPEETSSNSGGQIEISGDLIYNTKIIDKIYRPESERSHVMSSPKVSVIIPAFNEEPNIGGLIGSVRSLYPEFEIVVIDDGSTDGTGDAACQAGATVYRHPYNIGNGAAIKSGIRVASGDILVFMDADGQHDPAEIQELLAVSSGL